MMKQAILLLFLAFGLTLSVSDSKFGSLLPQAADQSFSVGYIQMKSAENCSYRVVISTSCSSPKFTTDEISIVFGDAYGNQVYGPKLSDPISKTFEQCSSDTFEIDGACASNICYVYLYRSGANENDGWKPETLKIFSINTNPITFDFNISIPNATWFGYNLCHFPKVPPPPPFEPFIPTTPPPFHPFPPTIPPPHPSSSYKLFTPICIIYVVLGFVFGFGFYV
ncbi:hypothetical protein Lal_00028743 [Lupinus albus]|uniref:Putative PLAT/LH2 domain-containing protein n=1 Tax=Lupinus albus TaxID=3870 RepID=A0A6A4NG24_LUPAL|nr:putative PLAT/LH2 domain-containing protein [Lupinus albus]KAF1884856.1 hypothetical protein Lal_00028743 [Lupinus albus]